MLAGSSHYVHTLTFAHMGVADAKSRAWLWPPDRHRHFDHLPSVSTL